MFDFLMSAEFLLGTVMGAGTLYAFMIVRSVRRSLDEVDEMIKEDFR